MVYGLNRYGLTVNNAVALVAALYNIFTQSELHTDPTYERQLFWHEKIFKWLNEQGPLIRAILYLTAYVVVCAVAIFAPELLVPMLLVAAKAAITGLIIGGVMGGLSAAMSGGNIFKGIIEGAVYGALDGAAVAIIVFGIVTAIKAIANAVKAANLARAQRAIEAANAVKAQQAATQPTKPAHGNSLKSTKPTELYELRDIDTRELMKYGETTRGKARYTQEFYRTNNVQMEVIANGTKAEMRALEKAMLMDYFDLFDKLPPLNKAFH